MKPTAATINQEVKDFKETYKGDIQEIKATLHEILTQAKHTNGRVTKVETMQIECPARDSFKQGKISYNIWHTVTTLIAIAAIIVAWFK